MAPQLLCAWLAPARERRACQRLASSPARQRALSHVYGCLTEATPGWPTAHSKPVVRLDSKTVLPDSRTMTALVLHTRPARTWIVPADHVSASCRSRSNNGRQSRLLRSETFFSGIQLARSRIEGGLRFRQTAPELSEKDGLAIEIADDRPELILDQSHDRSSHRDPDRIAVPLPRRPHRL